MRARRRERNKRRRIYRWMDWRRVDKQVIKSGTLLITEVNRLLHAYIL